MGDTEEVAMVEEEQEGKQPRRGEVWRHRKFGHLIRVEACLDGLIGFHTMKAEADRKARRFSSERRVRIADFWRMYVYDETDQSAEES